MSRIAVAAGTRLAAEIGAEVSRAGGNAVDAAVATTFVTWVCEPGLTAMGSGAFCTVWAPDAPPVTFDGFVDLPAGLGSAEVRARATTVMLAYGGGSETIVGPASVAVPGALRAIEAAWRRFGRMPWADLVRPAARLARTGAPLPGPSHYYFDSSGELIYGLSEGGRGLVRRADGTRYARGERVPIPDLADTLEALADEGAELLYGGAIGRAMGEWLRANGGFVGPEDFAAYEAVERRCLETRTGAWHLATNPGPAVGGVALIELAALMDEPRVVAWDRATIARFARAMDLVFTDRAAHLESGGLDGDGRAWLESTVPVRRGMLSSPSTSHTSAVDEHGLACAVTSSTGYGSGIMVPGTGVMLNNMLGEVELLPHGRAGRHTSRTRMPSNMAPSVVRSDVGHVVAFGAAGSDRIVSALGQVWLAVADLGLTLEEALAFPRCHLEWRDGVRTLSCEPGPDVADVPFAVRRFDDLHMFFGGVQAAARTPDGTLQAFADPRRDGGGVVV